MSAEIGKISAKSNSLLVAVDQRQKLRLLDLVHFIQEQKDGPVEAADPFDGETGRRGRMPAEASTIERKNVDAFEGVLQFVHHLAAEGVFRLVDAGRVDENDLRVVAIQDALNAIARGLRLGRNDGDFAADERIDERGFAGVGAADNGDESGFEGIGQRYCTSIELAAFWILPGRNSSTGAIAAAAVRAAGPRRPPPNAGDQFVALLIFVPFVSMGSPKRIDHSSRDECSTLPFSSAYACPRWRRERWEHRPQSPSRMRPS